MNIRSSNHLYGSTYYQISLVIASISIDFEHKRCQRGGEAPRGTRVARGSLATSPSGFSSIVVGHVGCPAYRGTHAIRLVYIGWDSLIRSQPAGDAPDGIVDKPGRGLLSTASQMS